MWFNISKSLIDFCRNTTSCNPRSRKGNLHDLRFERNANEKNECAEFNVSMFQYVHMMPIEKNKDNKEMVEEPSIQSLSLVIVIMLSTS